ncbi:hypothetical protein, partial [Devosia sp. Leaf64]|uniref:hypothetical protein n=1 Tax=Devosia sp. Leaf64 TaxID=1736229 RepID=UPI001AEBAF1E
LIIHPPNKTPGVSSTVAIEKKESGEAKVSEQMIADNKKAAKAMIGAAGEKIAPVTELDGQRNKTAQSSTSRR